MRISKYLFFSLFALLAFSACSDDDDGDSPSPSQENSSFSTTFEGSTTFEADKVVTVDSAGRISIIAFDKSSNSLSIGFPNDIGEGIHPVGDIQSVIVSYNQSGTPYSSTSGSAEITRFDSTSGIYEGNFSAVLLGFTGASTDTLRIKNAEFKGDTSKTL